MNNVDRTNTMLFQFGQTDEIEFTLASPKTRIKARLLNYLFDVLLFLPSIILAIIINNSAQTSNAMRYTTLVFGINIIAIIIFYIYQLILMCKYGQSLGKRICNIRVIKTDGSNPGFFGYCIRREFLYYFIINCISTIFIYNKDLFDLMSSVISFICFIICFIMLFKHKQHRTLQDLLAKTLVIQCEPKYKK